jgi:hypothetical protein
MEDCFICRKHNAQEAAPPGGYLYEDECWMVCHAPDRLVSRRKDISEHGLKFLARDDSCSDEDAAELASKLREAVK